MLSNKVVVKYKKIKLFSLFRDSSKVKNDFESTFWLVKLVRFRKARMQECQEARSKNVGRHIDFHFLHFPEEGQLNYPKHSFKIIFNLRRILKKRKQFIIFEVRGERF